MDCSSFRAVQKRGTTAEQTFVLCLPFPKKSIIICLKKVVLSLPNAVSAFGFVCVFSMLRWCPETASRVSWCFSVLYCQCTWTGLAYFLLQWPGPLISCADGLVKLVGDTLVRQQHAACFQTCMIVMQLPTTIGSWRTISFPFNSKQLPVFSD